MNTPIASETTKSSNSRRRIALLAIAAVVLLIGIGWTVYWFVHGRWFESTDNAYVGGNVVQITPQIGGTVSAIYAEDTDFVRSGQPLVRLDPRDAAVELAQAQAQLGETVRQVRALYANNTALAAAIELREAEARRAEADLARARDDLARRQALTGDGAVSKEELDHARTSLANASNALSAARAAVVAAREQWVGNTALIEGTNIDQHPNVQLAAARVREAYLATTRTELPAPVSGYVARRSVQVGQRVASGAPLMAVVPLDQIWVDANFKEGQLREMRIGQHVSLTADVYGGKVHYDGRIIGVGAGTGSAFALLPAQNATGNWIKVVQRVPVRIALDAQQVAAHPLRIGLSMEAEVDLHDRSGKALSDAPRQAPVAQTAVFDTPSAAADDLIARIIADNLGREAHARRDSKAPPVRLAARVHQTSVAH
ncbi:MAG TPA: efflux RND transporter periplasmic adaptor subunit [Burkholderiaceae bacterium]|nr:efflux RND transporter periplasmic adaptor subunit [Burkholderiaceae bacterium]